MTLADWVCFGIMLAMIALGLTTGFIRGLSLMVGAIVGFAAMQPMLEQETGGGRCLAVFFGILAVSAAAGHLIYGATRLHPIESLEGVFGAVFGFVAGIATARAVMVVAVYFAPDGAFATAISGSMIAYDVYTLSPLKIFLSDPTVRQLREPQF